MSWELLESLKNRCDLPWVVFGDFNHLNERLGWMDCEAKQMEDFRNCLHLCGLYDFGFMGQKYTWCNKRLGEQWTLIILDRVVANERRIEAYLEAKVHHVLMSMSNHCLLALFLRKPRKAKLEKIRFFFKAMWTGENKCKEVIEAAWDPMRVDPDFQIQDRIKNFQSQLQRWDRNGFDNVNKVLKQKKITSNNLNP